MDALFTAVIRLYEQGLSVKEIESRLKVSHGKVTKILITAGYIETAESKLLKQGLSIDEICERLGKGKSAVAARLPYVKGQYNAEYQTINALRIKACRERREKTLRTND